MFLLFQQSDTFWALLSAGAPLVSVVGGLGQHLRFWPLVRLGTQTNGRRAINCAANLLLHAGPRHASPTPTTSFFRHFVPSQILFNFSKISISSSNDALYEVCWHSFNHLKPPLHWSPFVALSAHQSFVVSVLFHCCPSFVVPLFLFASPISILSFMTDILFVHPLLFSFLSPFLIDVRFVCAAKKF